MSRLIVRKIVSSPKYSTSSLLLLIWTRTLVCSLTVVTDINIGLNPVVSKDFFSFLLEQNKCPANETMAWCVVDCAYQYCPTNDSLEQSSCPSPRGKCSPGCVCQWNHKRLSVRNRRCILASDCRKFQKSF